MSDQIEPMDVTQIKEALPHRFPFLMLDRIIGGTVGETITAQKDVASDEPYFAGHFPGNPIMPGVLVIEAMAQAGGVLSHVTMIDVEPKPLFFLAGVDKARFRRTVLPGDQLTIRVDADRVKRGIWFYRCEATVDGKLAVAADIMCAPGGER
ncbi:MAG: 3-hydroxyacyl-ACP dehydratase FabZ [Woeseiaceae bacterium]